MPVKRKASRHKNRYAIKFGIHKPMLPAFTEDVSAHGLFLRTTIVAPVGTRILIDLILPNNDKVSFVGVIRWVEMVGSQVNKVNKAGIGVEIKNFLYGEAFYQKLIAELNSSEINQALLFLAA
jgi:Tfp pilus assembly protein PilZ